MPFVVYVVAQSLQRAGLLKVEIVGIVLAIHYFQNQKKRKKKENRMKNNWTQIKTNYNCNYATFLCALLQATRSK